MRMPGLPQAKRSQNNKTSFLQIDSLTHEEHVCLVWDDVVRILSERRLNSRAFAVSGEWCVVAWAWQR